jgi:hypothetical protein
VPDWRIVKIAAAVSALVAGVTAAAGVVKWIQAGSITQAGEFAVEWAGRVGCILAIPVGFAILYELGENAHNKIAPGRWKRTKIAVMAAVGLWLGAVLTISSVSAAVENGQPTTTIMGVMLLAIGAAIGCSAAWVHRQRRLARWHECPDCCEMILARARVCRYCGFRFAPSPTDAAAASDDRTVRSS